MHAGVSNFSADRQSREPSWEPSPFTWDNVQIAPTPGYHLSERPPEIAPRRQQRQQEAAEVPPQQRQEHQRQEQVCPQSGDGSMQSVALTAPESEIDDDPFVQQPAQQPTHQQPPQLQQQQRQSAASQASSGSAGGRSARSVRSTGPVDLLPIPAHAHADPVLR